MKNELTEAVRFFTEETHILACMSVTCGGADWAEYDLAGEQRPGMPLTERAVYDLASLTKLFTAVLAMRLRESGKLDIERPVAAYAPRFAKLTDLSVFQLMTFSVPLRTPGRVDACADRESALRTLYAVEPGTPTTRAYSDMHCMVLKHVIEGAAGMTWMELARQQLFRPLGMTRTWGLVPAEARADCVDYSREHRIDRDRYLLREGPLPGDPHDPKAAVLQTGTEDVAGHAGLFSSRADMERFCRAILRGEVLSAESLRWMAVNRTGHPLPGGRHSQYLGCQCYVRHPVQYYSEVPAHMSDRTIALSGFTGNHLSVDPEQGVFTLQLGNRVYDRLTMLNPEPGKKKTDYGLNPDGTGRIRWTDGEEIYSSVDYVHQKDAHLHLPVKACIDRHRKQGGPRHGTAAG